MLPASWSVGKSSPQEVYFKVYFSEYKLIKCTIKLSLTINLYVEEAFWSHYAYLLAFEVFASNRLTMRFVYIVYIILKL